MTGTGPVTMQYERSTNPRKQVHIMALPTGKHATRLSLRAKLLKAHILANDLGLTGVANKAFALYTEIDALISPTKARNAKRKIEEDIEGDDAAE